MAASKRFKCTTCSREFYRDFIAYVQLNIVLCNFCKIKDDIQDATRKEYEDRILSLECRLKDVETKLLKSENENKQLKAKLNPVDKHVSLKTPNPLRESSSLPRRYHMEDENDVLFPDIHLVGDSNLRGQTEEFCTRRKGVRTNTFYPGAGVDFIANSCFQTKQNDPKPNELTIILAGTNDTDKEPSNIVDKFGSLIGKARSIKKKIAICSILPRYDSDEAVRNKIRETNTGIKDLCKKENVPFFDIHSNFTDPELFSGHGLHLNPVGKARLGRIIDDKILNHLQETSKTETNGKIKIKSQSETVSK